MRYFIDCEFNSFGGELLAMALINEKGESRYWHKFAGRRLPTQAEVLNPADDVKDILSGIDPWVKENVIPFLDDCPVKARPFGTRHEFAQAIYGFLAPSSPPVIVADWPADILYFCDAIQSGPGMMPPLSRLEFLFLSDLPTQRYFVANPQAVRHNAWWDAMSLKECVDQ